MDGLGLNAGYIAWWDRKASEDARILQILFRAGAVFHARTTQPQTLMHLETDNNLYGVTVSPFNTSLSAGGSSGGEGAWWERGEAVLVLEQMLAVSLHSLNPISR